MDREDSENRIWPLLVVFLLVIALVGGTAVYLVVAAPSAPSGRGETPAASSGGEAPTVKVGKPPEPANEPAPEEKPKPPPEDKFDLPPLTPFRKLVLEADCVEAFRAMRNRPAEPELRRIAFMLEGVHSDFAWYTQRRLSEDEWDTLAREAARAFENPDTYSPNFERQEVARVNFWLYESAKLPATETVIPQNARVPWQRRPHEGVTLEAALSWLEAIEGEFGATDFGKTLPLDIVVFADQPRYLEFARKRMGLNPPNWSAGFYTSGWDVIFAPVLESTALAEVLRHEMFHAVQARLAPRSLRIPWFAEGTAEWLDKAPPKGGALATHAGFSAAARSYLRFLVEKGLKLELGKYLALDMAAFYAEPEINYLIAYCWIDFLRSQKDLRPVLSEFWNQLKNNASPDDAFYRTFGQWSIDELQRRFIAWLGEVRAEQTPVRFVHDAPGDVKDIKWPAALGGVPAVSKEGEIGSGWYQAVARLEQAGFSSPRAPAYLKGDYDALVVACDNSESMGKPLDEATFDFEAFRRWLYSVRMAGSIKLTRKVEGSDRDEEVPPVILISLVEAVITNRVEEFTTATGISVGKDLQDQIRVGYEEFFLTTEKLKSDTRRKLCLYAAESVAWYWGVRQDKARVTLIDFNTGAMHFHENAAFKGNGIQSSSSPLQRLFAQAESRMSPPGSDGADTDWWAGLQKLPNETDVPGKRIAIMFFTDGPCSAGEFGQVETARDDVRYAIDMQKLAERFGEKWNERPKDPAQAAVLQLFALPHAENQGLDELLKVATEARLDTWATRFKK